MTETPQQPEAKQDPRDTVIAALVSILLVPFFGILRAYVFQILWAWFLLEQYGDGPTLKAWFGIGTLSAWLTTALHKPDTSAMSKHPIRDVFERAFVGATLLGAALVSAALARALWGWR